MMNMHKPYILVTYVIFNIHVIKNSIIHIYVLPKGKYHFIYLYYTYIYN